MFFAWHLSSRDTMTAVLPKIESYMSQDARAARPPPDHRLASDDAKSRVTALYNQAARIQWREVLKSFNNVKTLRLPKAFLWELSLSLQVYDGESPMEVLPELKEPRCNASEDDVPDTFDAFLEAREDASFPVRLLCRA